MEFNMGIFNWAVTKTGRMFGYGRIKEDTQFIYNLPKQYAELSKKEYSEVKFEKLTKEVVEIKKQKYIFLIKVSIFMFLLFIGLDIYQFYKGEYLSGLGCLIVTTIPAIFVLKYHYYYTVLQKKSLLTLKEYFELFRQRFK